MDVVHFEAVASSWENIERCLFFIPSAFALSCLIVDHLL